MSITRNLRDGVLKIKDGGVNEVTVAIAKGDLQFSVRKDYRKIMNRGNLDSVRAGDQQDVAVSFSLIPDRVSEATSPVTVYDALQKIKSASGWASVAAAHEPYAVEIEFTINDPAAGGSDDEVISLDRFFVEEISFQEGDEANELSVSGFAHITAPTIS